MPMAQLWTGVEVEYKTTGDPEDPALLFVAGLGGGISSWVLLELVYNFLNRNKRFLIMYNPRGTYDNPDVPDYEFQAMVDDAAALLDHLGVQKADVLGWSLGGAVAQMFAITYPTRLKKLILCATVPMGPQDDPALAPLLEAMGEMMGGLVEEPTAAQMEQMMDIIAERSFNGWLFQTLVGLMVKLAPIIQPGMYEDTSQQIGAMINLDTWNRLGEIEAQTLVLHGDADGIIPYPLAPQLLTSRIRNARMQTIAGGAHALAMENFWATTKAVQRFLR